MVSGGRQLRLRGALRRVGALARRPGLVGRRVRIMQRRVTSAPDFDPSSKCLNGTNWLHSGATELLVAETVAEQGVMPDPLRLHMDPGHRP